MVVGLEREVCFLFAKRVVETQKTETNPLGGVVSSV